MSHGSACSKRNSIRWHSQFYCYVLSSNNNGKKSDTRIAVREREWKKKTWSDKVLRVELSMWCECAYVWVLSVGTNTLTYNTRSYHSTILLHNLLLSAAAIFCVQHFHIFFCCLFFCLRLLLSLYLLNKLILEVFPNARLKFQHCELLTQNILNSNFYEIRWQKFYKIEYYMNNSNRFFKRSAYRISVRYSMWKVFR